MWSLISLANLYNLDKPDTALRLYVESFGIARAKDHKAGILTALQQIGVAYHVIGDYPKALQYYFRVLPLLEDTHDTANIAGLYNLELVNPS